METVEQQCEAESSAVAVPEDLLCPVLHTLFRDPVVNVAGNTYERVALEQIKEGSSARRLDQDGAYSDPLTNHVVHDEILIPNWDMRRRVQAFLDANIAYIPDGWAGRSVPLPSAPVRSGPVRSDSQIVQEVPDPGTVLSDFLYALAAASIALGSAYLHASASSSGNLFGSGGTCASGQCSVGALLPPSSGDEAFAVPDSEPQGSNKGLAVSWQGILEHCPNVRTYMTIFAFACAHGFYLLGGWQLRTTRLSTALFASLSSCTGRSLITFLFLEFLCPGLPARPMCLIGMGFLFVSSVWQETDHHLGVDTIVGVNGLTTFLLARNGAFLSLLGCVSHWLPDFANRASTLSGVMLMGMAHALADVRTIGTWKHVDTIAVNILGCTGMVSICFGAIPALSHSPPALSGACMMITGAALHELDQKKAFRILVAGMIMVSSGVILNQACRLEVASI